MKECDPRLSGDGTEYIHAHDCETAIKLGLRRDPPPTSPSPGPSDRVLVGALMWLRNHYDVGNPALKETVIARIDKVLQDADVRIADARAFRDAYPIEPKKRRSKG